MYLLLDIGPQSPQSLLEVLVAGFEGGTFLSILECLVQLPQLFQGLAAPVQGFDIRSIDINSWEKDPKHQASELAGWKWPVQTGICFVVNSSQCLISTD